MERRSDTADAERRDRESAERQGGETGSRIERRQLLRIGSNLGVGAALVWGFGSQYALSDDLGTITYAIARPTPDSGSPHSRIKEVPVAWHERLLAAFTVQATIRSMDLSHLVDSFVVPGSFDKPEASISVGATTDGVVETLKDVAGDVPVDVYVLDEIPPKEDDAHDLSDAYQISELDLDADTVPGGVLCEADGSYGTLTPALYESGTPSPFFATSNHVFGATKETEHQGEPLSVIHGDESYQIGRVRRGYPSADIVRVAPADGYRPVSEIERAVPSRVIGQYTKFGLADLMARDEKLTKIGAITGRTTGGIEGIDGVTCYTGEICRPGQLKWGGEETLTDGDSGSVNYHPDPENPDEYVLIGGINNARTWWPGADFTWGTAAHHLFDEYGLHF